MGSISGKALILQGLFLLFLPGFCAAQSIYIDKPNAHEALEETQEFHVSVLDADPVRVEFFLNGRLVQARKVGPFLFKTSWDTRFVNKVRFVAHLADGQRIEVTREFQELKVDLETELEAFQFFPLVEDPAATLAVFAAGKQVTPQRLALAREFQTLHLQVVLDVSGSMKFFLGDVAPKLRALVDYGRQSQWDIRFFVFDSSPRQIKLEELPSDLSQLYIGRSQSIVYDGLATAAEMFARDSRRVILLVSDGHDDGSKNDLESVGAYLKKGVANLIWINPTVLKNEGLSRLADLSGGFSAFADEVDPWPSLAGLLQNQYQVVAPDVTFPVLVKASSGRVFYPKWKN